MLQRAAEQLDERRPLAARRPMIADAGLRCGDGERRPAVSAARQEIVEEVRQILDGLRFAKRQHRSGGPRFRQAFLEFVEKR